MNRITFGDWHYVDGFGLRADTFKNCHRIGTTERNHNGYVYFTRLLPGELITSDSIMTLASKL